jgi:hypothetical protein
MPGNFWLSLQSAKRHRGEDVSIVLKYTCDFTRRTLGAGACNLATAGRKAAIGAMFGARSAAFGRPRRNERAWRPPAVATWGAPVPTGRHPARVGGERAVRGAVGRTIGLEAKDPVRVRPVDTCANATVRAYRRPRSRGEQIPDRGDWGRSPAQSLRPAAVSARGSS